MTLSVLIGTLIPTAAAQGVHLSDVGRQDASVRTMWSAIAKIFPHVDIGSAAVTVLAGNIIQFLLLLIGSVAVAVIIYSSIRIIIARGEDIAEPKKAIMYALLGLVLAVLADIVVAHVIALIGVAAS